MTNRGNPANPEALAALWARLVPPDPATDEAWRALGRRWGEPHRRYHDLAHLGAVLDRLDDLAAAGVRFDPVTVRLAAYLHDAVYDPRSATNEADSAALAREVLRDLGLPAGIVAAVARLVLVTRDHAPEPGDGDGAALCDADLAVLAGPPEAYVEYARAVREEYAFVPDASFRAGRAEILERLLDRPAIYATDPGRTWWEDTARQNLRAELRDLRAAAGEAPPPAGD